MSFVVLENQICMLVQLTSNKATSRLLNYTNTLLTILMTSLTLRFIFTFLRLWFFNITLYEFQVCGTVVRYLHDLQGDLLFNFDSAILRQNLSHLFITSSWRFLSVWKSTWNRILTCPHSLILLLLQLSYHSIKNAGLWASLPIIISL